MRWIKSVNGLTRRNDGRRGQGIDKSMDDRIDVVTLAIELPGASAILRAAGINFQAGDRPSLADAAQARGAPLAPLLARLHAHARALAEDDEDRDDGSRARAQGLLLTEGVRLARGLEARFAHRPGCPNGLASAMQDLADAFARHDAVEREAGSNPEPALIARLIDDHRLLKEKLDHMGRWLGAPAVLEALGPAGAVLAGVWRALDRDVRRRVEIEDRQLLAACDKLS